MKLRLWAEQYSSSMGDVELDHLIGVPPVQAHLGPKGTHAAPDILASALARVVVPDAQTRSLLRQFIGMAQAHASSHFDSDTKYLEGLYAESPWGIVHAPAVCFTGLQGVGKTAVLGALARVLTSRTTTLNVVGHANISAVPIWNMTLAKGDGLNQLLRQHVDSQWEALQLDGIESRKASSKNWSIPKLLRVAERRSWLHATCLAAIDEFQWISASASANARAASLLLKLHSIGPLLIYGANFSLVHKLRGRPPEERDRLLTRPIIMRPFAPDSQDLVTYLKALQSVAPSALLFDADRDAEKFYLYTYGIRRKIVDLISAAFRISCRTRRLGQVGAQELLVAYRSELYALHREDVEILFKQQVTGRMDRESLWCPFQSTEMTGSNVTEATKIVAAFEKRIEDALLDSALMPTEVSALEAIEPNQPKAEKAGRVVKFRRGKATKAELIAGAAALDALD